MDTIVSNSELSIFISFFYKRGMSPWTLCPCDDDTIGKRKMHHLLLTAVKETLKKKMRNNSASFWKEILCYIRRFVCHGHVKRHLIWSHDMQVWPPFFFYYPQHRYVYLWGKEIRPCHRTFFVKYKKNWSFFGRAFVVSIFRRRKAICHLRIF